MTRKEGGIEHAKSYSRRPGKPLFGKRTERKSISLSNELNEQFERRCHDADVDPAELIEMMVAIVAVGPEETKAAVLHKYNVALEALNDAGVAGLINIGPRITPNMAEVSK